MLSNPELFKKVEDGLKENGIIKGFEDEHGPVLGRVMITTTEIPDGVKVVREDRENLTAFEASFDFCNVTLGVVVDTKKKTLESSVWGRYQVAGATRPTEDWVKFFIRTLVEHIDEDGNFGVPMYCFVNDTSDFTAVPTMPNPTLFEGMFKDVEPESEQN